MALPSLPVTLKRGVGRRILGLFMLAGILPVMATAALAYFEVARSLDQSITRSLRTGAQQYGIDVRERLQRRSNEADEVARSFERLGPGGSTAQAHKIEAFDAVWYLSDTGQETRLYGAAVEPIDMAEVARAIDRSRNARLMFAPGQGSSAVLLVRRVDSGPSESAMLVFRARAARIWGSEVDLPFATDFCVFNAGGDVIHCTRPTQDGLHDAVSGAGAFERRLSVPWEQDGDTYLAAAWQLFLTGEFGVPSLDIVAMQPEAIALQSRSDFRGVFMPALILVIVLVGLLSFSLIGRSLVPLQKLSTAVRQIAAGNLDARVRIRSGDEFERLGEAFNYMADRLGRQITTLEAMSEIDKLILSGADFEEVSEYVITHLIALTGSEAAAVIARDTDTPHWAKMISAHDQEFRHERIPLPMELGHDWCQPRQVSLKETAAEIAPYKETFLSYGQGYVALIPVVLNGELKGILLLGGKSRFNMHKDSLLRSIDLAGRFAVALASVEREEALYRQAHFDELTGLPNRQLLKDRLEQQVLHARREGFSGAMLFLDLDRFKEINDIFGHSVGDAVLTQAAERIVAEVRESDTVARLGGDEFVVVLNHVAGDNEVRTMATRLLDRLTESFTVRGKDHFVGASIGIVLYPDDGVSVETLLKNADAAMYRAKEAGRARFEFFSKKLNAASRRKIGLERDLRTAFNNRQLEIYYQPQFDIATSVISGAEALLRWEHEAEGFVSPAEFVPLAEDSTLIIEIGRWVIERTCRDLRGILDRGLHPGPVSINVSARQLRDSGFTSDVLESLQRNRIHPGFLQLEVTETTVAQNRDVAIAILETLRAEGVRVAIDDFGTGYSSLSYLQQMPFDLIKIDKSFVDRIGAGDPSDNICRTIIHMAHEMGRKAIAEGVEKRSQIDFLKKNGCDFVQGFVLSRPLPRDEFVEFIEKQDFHTQRRKALEIIS